LNRQDAKRLLALLASWRFNSVDDREIQGVRYFMRIELNSLILVPAAVLAVAVLVRPALVPWPRAGEVPAGPYTFLATDLREFTQTHEVREQFKRLRYAYHDRLRLERPGAEWELLLLNHWETLGPHALRYGNSFDYCYGFGY
jgi:hypothetical protein